MAHSHNIFKNKDERFEHFNGQNEEEELRKRQHRKSRKLISVRSHSVGNFNPFLSYLTESKEIMSSFFDVRYKQKINLELLYHNSKTEQDKSNNQFYQFAGPDDGNKRKKYNPQYTGHSYAKSWLSGGQKSKNNSFGRRDSKILAVKYDSDLSAEFDEKGDWLSSYHEIERTNSKLEVSNNRRDNKMKSNISNFGAQSILNKTLKSNNSGIHQNSLSPDIHRRPQVDTQGVNYLVSPPHKPERINLKRVKKDYKGKAKGRSSPAFDNYLQNAVELNEFKLHGQEIDIQTLSELDASEQEDRILEKLDLRFDVEPTQRGLKALDSDKMEFLSKTVTRNVQNLCKNSKNLLSRDQNMMEFASSLCRSKSKSKRSGSTEPKNNAVNLFIK